ncbi:MAG TPA: AarF/UbiB family protein [Polyangiaceae bacterium]
MSTSSSPAFSSRSSRRSESRRGRSYEPFAGADSTPGTLGPFLAVFDALLVAVEETAWNARNLGELASQAYLRSIGDWQRTRQDLGGRSGQFSRFTRTGLTLARITGSYRLHRVKRAFLSKARARAELAALHAENARLFYAMSAEHGGAFVKVGQLLSARADLLPDVWVRELAKLQDALPGVSFREVQGILESELGAPLEALFASIEREPVAAASIGQVHRAVTHDGQEVAVKVQRPNIGSAVRGDLQMLEMFVRALGREIATVDAETCIAAIRSAVLRELDYCAEAETTRAVSCFFDGDARVTAPMPVDGLCSERVLTTTFMRGQKISVVLDAWQERRIAGDAFAGPMSSAILGRLLEGYLRQVLELGTFQADPHPGNLLVLEDDRVCILDFGCAERLTPELRRRYLDVLRFGIAGDTERVSALLGELGFETASGRPETLRQFADALLGELRQMATGSVSWPSGDELSERAQALLKAYRDDPVVRLPAEFVMIGRLFLALSGLFSRYQPQIDFVRHVLPVLQTALTSPAAG